jgi:hypothetical protein
MRKVTITHPLGNYAITFEVDKKYGEAGLELKILAELSALSDDHMDRLLHQVDYHDYVGAYLLYVSERVLEELISNSLIVEPCVYKEFYEWELQGLPEVKIVDVKYTNEVTIDYDKFTVMENVKCTK